MEEVIRVESVRKVTYQDKEKSRKFLLWLSIVSMIMLFAAFTSAFIVMRTGNNWMKFDIPVTFTISTIVLAVSSGTMMLAVSMMRKGKKGFSSLFTFLTLILGLVFARLQFIGYGELVQNDVYFVDNLTNSISGSFFYVITGMHLLHMIGGLFALLITGIRTAAGGYSKERYLGLKLTAIFWHFLDILWLYLFVFLHLYQ